MTNSSLPDSVRQALERTAQTVRKEETLLTLCQAVVGTCVFFGLIVLVEHWILPRGIPTWARFILDFIFWGLCVWVFCRRILPFLIWKLNPFYLASVIEKARPDLKNGLLNLLYLKKAPPTPAGNLAALAVSRQITGAEDVPYLPAQQIRWWKWGAAAAVVLCVLYSIFSPKSALRSVARTLFPWANISVPTRVRLDTVQPGNCTLYQGETLTVSARIRRLKENETPILFYSSEDKKFVNAPVSMNADSEKPGFWSARVPDVQQNLTWRLEAGDAQSETFQLTVLPPLRVTIESLRLTPPAYTNLPVVTQTAGDVQTVVGTQIDLIVRTSEPAREVTLKLDGKAAVTFTPLEEKGLKSQTRFRAEFQETFVPCSREASIHFQNQAGRTNEPLKYRWDILPDAGPEVRILEGPKDDSSLDETEETTIKISASDPDFGLRAVAIRAEWNGKPLAIPPLLNLPRDRAGLRTPFEAEFAFRPSGWNLKAGDEIVWWAEAADTQEPAGNRTRTGKRLLKIVGKTSEKEDSRNDSNTPGINSESESDEQENSPLAEEKNEEKSPFPVSAEMPNQEDAKAQGEELDGEETTEQSVENAPQTSSGEGEKSRKGEQSGNQEGEKDNSDQGQGNGQGTGSGDGEGENPQNGGSKNDSGPKTAEEDYDPLDESEAQNGENHQSEEKSGEKSGETGKNSGESGETNDSGDAGDSGKSGESGGTDEEGENSSRKEEREDSRNTKPGGQQKTSTGQKSQEKGNGKRQQKGQNSDLEQETDAEEGEELEERGENGKKTGPDSQNGAKSESEVPEDATNAQSGLQNGTDSDQDLPAPVKEKENSDGSGLQDSNSNRPNRDKMEDDSDETGEPNAENTHLAGKDEMEGSKPDPVSNPGEAMEEILKHRQKELEKAGKLPPNSESPSGKNGDSQAPAPQTDAQAEMGKDPKELKKNESNPESKEGEGENKKEKQSGQSSPQDGSQQGNAGDRKSKNAIKPDNSAEASGKAGENKGGNRQGSQEQSDQQGLGRDGSNTPNESGNPAGSGGEGPKGERGGNSALADHPTGSADPNQTQGNGSDSQKGGRESQAYGSGHSTEQSEHATVSGGSGLGSEMPARMGEESSAMPSTKEDAVNVEFARQQTILALDHLRDALDRDDDSLLEYLGWTREEARQFLKEWEKLYQDLTNPKLSEQEFRERQDAFRSLGITPRTIQYKDRTKKETVRPNARGGRKVEAPEAWREQFEAYSRGVGEGK